MNRPLLLSALVAASSAQAQVALDPVTITAERTRQTTFDAPAAITAVTRDVIDSGGPQVNLSEALNRVPGIAILNRQNYAQDLQLSIRGFGSRSTFGIRGVRLIVDGIPATMPDGQGQASSIALSSTQRIEVLRGPLAQLYGNAAGGVVQIFSGPDAGPPSATASIAAGPYGLNKIGARFSSAGAQDSVVLDASRFATDGYRPHSEAVRAQLNGKWEHDIDAASRLSLVVNALEQPLSQDPIGLRRDQWQADPRQTDPIAITQDARKAVSQQQIGATYERQLGAQTTLNARLYFGTRGLDNALSTPAAAQQSNTSSGGIVVFTRGYMGTGLQLSHAIPLGEGQALRLTGGLEYDHLNEDRKGFINNAGVQGILKRDEHNTVEDQDLYAQAAWDITRTLTATAGVRSSHVRFESRDAFVKAGTPNNGDDSGSVSYSATNPVLGLSWRAAETLNLYANTGRGFETPTLTELAYRPAPDAGLNFDLRAARSRHNEVGAKWKINEQQRLDLAYFLIRTSDEIVVDTNSGGRTTYRNAGRTSRRGVELQYLARLGEEWRTTLNLATLRARFVDNVFDRSNTLVIASGNRLPGTPDRTGFAELAWTPKNAWGGLNAGVEVVHTGKLYVNDANSDAAPAATLLNLRLGFAQTVGAWTFTQLLRVDNATDRNYAGSVIVNDANSRFFEPALPRTWLVGLSARVSFP